jgi:hypothetical protein
MLTNDEIKKKALRKYNSYLKSLVVNSNIFPLNIIGNKQVATTDFSQATKIYEDFYKNSKSNKGYGYCFDYEKNKKTSITKIYFETEKDFVKYIAKEVQATTFLSNINMLRERLDISDEIIIENISKISKWDEDFCKNLALTTGFLIENQKSNLYKRELPIHVPTKFLEKNIVVITNFLSNFISIPNVENKYQKLGLIDKTFIIKIRAKDKFTISDINGNNCGNTEVIFLTPKAFENFTYNPKRVFIVENETTFFKFPLKENDICLYSGGFSILSFKNNKMLMENNTYYFGDIDEHGFAILSMFREIYPGIKSIFMDTKTLNKFTKFEIEGKEYQGILNALNMEETKVYEYIKENNLRLEQERIPIHFIKNELELLS